MAQTHVLTKHLENHGHLDRPDLIVTFTLDAWNTLWAAKGWVPVNAYGEPVEAVEDADPDRQDELLAGRRAQERDAARKDIVQRFTRKTRKTETAAPAAKAEG